MTAASDRPIWADPTSFEDATADRMAAYSVYVGHTLASQFYDAVVAMKPGDRASAEKVAQLAQAVNGRWAVAYLLREVAERDRVFADHLAGFIHDAVTMGDTAIEMLAGWAEEYGIPEPESVAPGTESSNGSHVGRPLVRPEYEDEA